MTAIFIVILSKPHGLLPGRIRLVRLSIVHMEYASRPEKHSGRKGPHPLIPPKPARDSAIRELEGDDSEKTGLESLPF
jgi:hypothetical protein